MSQQIQNRLVLLESNDVLSKKQFHQFYIYISPTPNKYTNPLNSNKYIYISLPIQYYIIYL